MSASDFGDDVYWQKKGMNGGVLDHKVEDIFRKRRISTSAE